MALTLQEFKHHQKLTIDLQRMALWYAERGEDRMSYALQSVAYRASKIRPTKEDPAPVDQSALPRLTEEQWDEAPTVAAVNPKKGKAA